MKIVVLKDRENVLLEGNPPQGWPWKQNSTIVVAAAMILRKKRVTDKYFEKKLDFQHKPSLYSALASARSQLQRQIADKS